MRTSAFSTLLLGAQMDPSPCADELLFGTICIPHTVVSELTGTHVFGIVTVVHPTAVSIAVACSFTSSRGRPRKATMTVFACKSDQCIELLCILGERGRLRRCIPKFSSCDGPLPIIL